METDHLTGRMGSVHQMVRLHSHNVNLMDMVTETETVSVNRPLGSVRLRPIYTKCEANAVTNLG